jgi:hypothetical protein
VLLNPRGEGSGIAGIQPEMAYTGEECADIGEYERGCYAIGKVGGMDDDLQEEAGGLDEEMAFAPVHFLGPVITPWQPFSVVLTD